MTPRRPRSPWWLAQPSRWAAIPAERARIVIGIAILVLAAAVASLAGARGDVPFGDRQVILHEGIVEGVRHGGDYYAVAADSLREGELPLRPTAAVPLPTLAVVEAALPRWGVIAGLWWLTAAVALAWWGRIASLLPRWPQRMIATGLLLAGLAAFVDPERVSLPIVWAGLLVALSLARRRPGRWGEAAAVALAAATLDVNAAILPAAMAALAWWEGDRREALGWIAVIAVVAVLLAVHAHGIAAVPHAGDPSVDGGVGAAAYVGTIAEATALAWLPRPVAATLATLGLLGWASLDAPLARRVTLTSATCATMAVLSGAGSFALLAAAPLLIGIAFVPDAVRDLMAGALDTRRIIVRRVVR